MVTRTSATVLLMIAALVGTAPAAAADPVDDILGAAKPHSYTTSPAQACQPVFHPSLGTLGEACVSGGTKMYDGAECPGEGGSDKICVWQSGAAEGSVSGPVLLLPYEATVSSSGAGHLAGGSCSFGNGEQSSKGGADVDIPWYNSCIIYFKDGGGPIHKHYHPYAANGETCHDGTTSIRVESPEEGVTMAHIEPIQYEACIRYGAGL